MEETNSIEQEATEQPVDPTLQKRITYTETLQQEIQNLQEQLANLQYQLDIRVTALVAYQSTLEVVEEPNQEKENEVVEESLEQN
jgi:chromosome condensin MukBEF ATPase and DNA-binding subunit MukB